MYTLGVECRLFCFWNVFYFEWLTRFACSCGWARVCATDVAAKVDGTELRKAQSCIDDEKNLVKQFCSDLRRLQQRRKCTDIICADIVLTLGRYLSVDLKNFRINDKAMQEAAGVSFLRLNGCVTCHKFVYLPQDRRTHCPRCGGQRFDDEGHALEV